MESRDGENGLLLRMPHSLVEFLARRRDSLHTLHPRTVPIMKLVIVGGVAGGASAAARARRLSEDAEIVLFERGPDVSFANCGLPYYVGGAIAEREQAAGRHARASARPLQSGRAHPLVGRGHRPRGEEGPRPRSGHRAGV